MFFPTVPGDGEPNGSCGIVKQLNLLTNFPVHTILVC